MGGYHLEKLEKNYLTPIDELSLLLENECSEAVIFNTVYYAANRIFKDIVEELDKCSLYRHIMWRFVRMSVKKRFFCWPEDVGKRFVFFRGRYIYDCGI